MKVICFVLVLVLFFSCSEKSERTVNLVPQEPATAPNYWCTWYAQNYWQQKGGEITDFEAINNPNAREELSYHHLYNEKDGWVKHYLPRGRSDWFFLIDHGWQTKEVTERSIPGAKPFFSLQIDPRDFKEYAHEKSQESLRLFNQEIIENGWRGLGLWTRGTIDSLAARTMVEWSKYAGIKYWKIDGGGLDNFYSYKIKEEIFPELQLEYITGSNGPLNPNWDKPDLDEYPSVYDFGGAKREIALKVLQSTDVFRTYDAAPLLVTTTTLQRTHDLLKQTAGNEKYKGILNLQDDPQVAAGLGCLVASKRHPNYMERTYKGEDFHHQIRGKRMIQKRMNEIERFGRWQRIAAAFPAGYGSYKFSTKNLTDSYPHTDRDTWFKSCWGKMVYQGAPAVMARNMPLPIVESDGEVPYVMASTYPNGAVCVATEGRVKPEDQWYHPRAKVSIKIKDRRQYLGIFGHYRELVLEFEESLDGINHIWVQDLLADGAVDVISELQITDRSITIPGDFIDRIGTMSGDEGDISVPGMVLKLEF